MSSLLSSENLHRRAMEIAARYRGVEAELIEIIQKIDEHRVYLKRGHSSLFQYVISELKLGENAAYCLMTVARKAREVPELKDRIESGAITLSNARRIAPVLTSANQAEWLEKASTLSNRQLEKELVRVHPKSATPEAVTYVTPERVKLSLGLSEREMLKLRRVQDLLSQSRKRAVSLEETIEVMTSEYLGRHDPVAKAKRHQVKRGAPVEVGPAVRAEISAAAGTIRATAGADAAVKVPIESEAENLGMASDLEAGDHDRIPNVSVGKLVTLRVVRSEPKRMPIPAAVLHRVRLRDQGRCTDTRPDGKRCDRSRWIEVHHRKPVREGGDNSLENLITLCATHHRRQHMKPAWT